jgi:hypothetical protein
VNSPLAELRAVKTAAAEPTSGAHPPSGVICGWAPKRARPFRMITA